ncbi:hypothetical protein [Acinetobacter sp. Marseille-Q1618]|uniref:hypothetical protein n=1 Tax=Acinetobacter sp. Marseille-Q1618 TaxID=2697502 RepID=UPI0015715D00|nr:hypothetical protein [Acinetobacter sp. Marseille-Q1618]
MSNKTLGQQNIQTQISLKSLIIGLILAALIFALCYFLIFVKNKDNVETKADPNAAQSVTAKSNDYSPTLHNNIAKVGEIKEVNKINGDLLAWTVIVNGEPQIIFTTKDESVVITGNAFDSNSMDSISLPLLQAAQQKFAGGQALASQGQVTPQGSVDFAEIVGEWKGENPPAIAMLSKLKGAKEGKGSDADTLYILYDPRCPNCHDAYRATRKYVEKGFSIKWIPTVLLKQSEDGYKLGAATLKDPTLLGKAFSKDTTGLPEASAEDKKAIDENQAFLVEAFKQSVGGNTIAVPSAFYLNKKTGQPKMTTGVSDNSILEMIFGKI